MSIEQKAKAYDEALKKIQPLYEQAKRDGNPIWSTYEYLIPELRESEDERIRKGLVKLLTVASEAYLVESTGIKKDSYLAYLEKQKEPKQTDLPAGFYFIDLDGNKYYSKEFRYGDMKVKVGEQKPVEWKLPDDFEEAVYKVANFISPFNSQEELRKVSHRFAEQLLDIAKKEQKPANISSLRDWKFIVDAVLTEHEGIGQYLDKPETERIAKKLQERFSLPQSKPAEWSEEDENALEYIHELISWGYAGKFMGAQTAHDMRKWVNEHLSRDTFQNGNSHWKPSEEQMEALKETLETYKGFEEYDAMKSLYNDLKKL